jgi:hypothetical protein
MMMQYTLPGIKAFFRNSRLSAPSRQMLMRLMIAFIAHTGRMSCSQAAVAVRSEARNRAAVTRFLANSPLGNSGDEYQLLAMSLLALETRRKGRWLLIVDKTCCSRQGTHTENTFSTGNRQRRPRKGRRYNQNKTAPKRCHGFVMGLVITPSGHRIPFQRCYYTKEYCAARKIPHATEADLGAELIRRVPIPEDAEVVVLGDTAYEAESVRDACAERGYQWITPVNPERVLAGQKPRAKVRSRILDLKARQFSPIRLTPGQGPYVAQRRVSACRIGPKTKTRTFYAHRERLAVHSVGETQVVFSTKEQPRNGKPLELDNTKILMTNDLTLSLREIVELYDLRWQIELFFKELKSTLGLHQYRFVQFSAVESWVECCLLTYLYLEWYRAVRQARRRLSKSEKEWWTRQRTHGLCHAIRQEAETQELKTMAQWSHTKTGMNKLKKLVRAAHPRECQIAG